jgi:hypothetical protein
MRTWPLSFEVALVFQKLAQSAGFDAGALASSVPESIFQSDPASIPQHAKCSPQYSDASMMF